MTINYEYDDPDEIIGVCSECHSDNPDSYVENNKFYQAGAYHVPCKFCKGRLIFVSRAKRDHALDIENRRRGIGISSPDDVVAPQPEEE